MEVGDSFLVTDRAVSSIKNSAVQESKRSGRKYQTKVQPNGGIRVWRIL